MVDFSLNGTLDLALYLLALINPVSKVFILTVLSTEHRDKELQRMALKSTMLAFTVLLSFAILGTLILKRLFHVEIYSLKVTGGLVLFFIGYKAISQGKFFEVPQDTKLTDVSIVPLVSPMMAGPATITAVISFSSDVGQIVTATAVFIALTVNLAVMMSYRKISDLLTKLSLMSPLIRLTGLIVSTIAVQMILDGLSEWFKSMTYPF
mgnify:CR=1 FL=1